MVKPENISASSRSFSPSRQTSVFSIFCLYSHICVRHDTGYRLKFRPDKYSLQCIYGEDVRRTLGKIYPSIFWLVTFYYPSPVSSRNPVLWPNHHFWKGVMNKAHTLSIMTHYVLFLETTCSTCMPNFKSVAPASSSINLGQTNKQQKSLSFHI